MVRKAASTAALRARIDRCLRTLKFTVTPYILESPDVNVISKRCVTRSVYEFRTFPFAGMGIRCSKLHKTYMPKKDPGPMPDQLFNLARRVRPSYGFHKG